MPQFDVKRVHEVRERRGLSEARLSTLAGLNRGSLRAMKSSTEPSYATVLSLANALGVTPDCLYPGDSPTWTAIHSFERERVNGILGELKHAGDVITCTQGMESYLQPDEMSEWTSVQFLKTPNWRVQDHVAYFDSQRAARSAASYRHRVFCRKQLVVQAASQVTGLTECFAASIQREQEYTALGMISEGNWGEFDKAVRKATPLAATGWDKVVLMDNHLAVVRVNRFYYNVTYHRPTVVALRQAVERCGSAMIQYGFPDARSGVHDWRATSDRAATVIKALLRKG